MSRVRWSFDDFVNGYVDDLLRTAFLITWDESEAEDLVQECLLRVAKRWPRVRGMEMPVAYARRILVNLALDGRGRRSRNRRELDSAADRISPAYQAALDLPDLDAEADLDRLGQRSELVVALGQLTPQQRTVLVLRYFQDLSEAQVADILGCSIGTVKSSASRGLARLRELVSSPRQTEVAEP